MGHIFRLALEGRTNFHLLGYMCSPRSYFPEMFDMVNQICEIVSPVMLLLDRIERKLDRLKAALCSDWYFQSHMLSRFSCVRLFVTLYNVALQFPLSMGFSRQECWRELPCPLPGDLPDPGIEPAFPAAPALQADSFTAEPLGKPFRVIMVRFNSEDLLCSSLCCLPSVYPSTS